MVFMRAFQRGEGRLLLAERIVDQRGPEPRDVLLPAARLQLIQNVAGIQRSARGRERECEVCLHSRPAALRFFHRRLELTNRFVQPAHGDECHAKLEMGT